MLMILSDMVRYTSVKLYAQTDYIMIFRKNVAISNWIAGGAKFAPNTPVANQNAKFIYVPLIGEWFSWLHWNF